MKRRKVAIKEAKLEAIEEFCPHCRRETSHILQWKYQRWAKDREWNRDGFSYRSCSDRGIDQTMPLGKRLQTLAFSDDLSPHLNKITHLLKQVGNIGAHADRNVTKDEARTMEKLFRLIIDYFYIVPNEITQLQKTMAEGSPIRESPDINQEDTNYTSPEKLQ